MRLLASNTFTVTLLTRFENLDLCFCLNCSIGSHFFKFVLLNFAINCNTYTDVKISSLAISPDKTIRFEIHIGAIRKYCHYSFVRKLFARDEWTGNFGNECVRKNERASQFPVAIFDERIKIAASSVYMQWCINCRS